MSKIAQQYTGAIPMQQPFPPQTPATPASSRALDLSWLIPALFTVAVVGYGVHLARQPRVAERAVPAALDPSLHNIPQAIATANAMTGKGK